ncbi:MAG: hypothetical protein ACRDT8_03965 [Micromonosporaceae bacterium]
MAAEALERLAPAQVRADISQAPVAEPSQKIRSHRRRRGKLRLAVAGVLTLVVLLGAGGLVLTGVVPAGELPWLDSPVERDSSDAVNGGDTASVSGADATLTGPTKVVDTWLDAMFIRKDTDKTIKLTCRKESGRDNVSKVVDDVKAAEADAKDADLRFRVSWATPKTIEESKAAAKVRTTLNVSLGDRKEEKLADFGLVFESGWKVCDAQLP